MLKRLIPALVGVAMVLGAAAWGAGIPYGTAPPYNDLGDINLLIQTLNSNGVQAFGAFCFASGATPQTCNTQRGVVTTNSLSTAASTLAAAYVINDSTVTTGSMVQCTVNTYSGTYGTNGVPIIAGCIPGAGTITVQIWNDSTVNALAGTVGIAFAVWN